MNRKVQARTLGVIIATVWAHSNTDWAIDPCSAHGPFTHRGPYRPVPAIAPHPIHALSPPSPRRHLLPPSFVASDVLRAGHGFAAHHDTQLRGLQLPVSEGTGGRWLRWHGGERFVCLFAALFDSGICYARVGQCAHLPLCAHRFAFGKTPEPEASDEAFATPCFQQCPSKKTRAGQGVCGGIELPAPLR